METKVVGTIRFGGHYLDVHSDLNKPLFRATEIAKLIDYSAGNSSWMVNLCEEDEKLNLEILSGGQKRIVTFVTELGLYNILSQSRKPIARGWRRIVHEELIQMRKNNGKDVVEQFEDWDHILDTLYVDEETGVLMQSVTIAGGDVEQIPFE